MSQYSTSVSVPQKLLKCISSVFEKFPYCAPEVVPTSSSKVIESVFQTGFSMCVCVESAYSD